MSKIILHVGLPKAASSALQSWFLENHEVLRSLGVDYPVVGVNHEKPKHDFMVRALKRGIWAEFDEVLARAAKPTLFLSSEGLTNNLHRFIETRLAEFRMRLCKHDVTTLLVTRDPVSWSKSFHKQAVLSAPQPNSLWATPLRLDEFRSLASVRKLGEADQLVATLKSTFGAQVTCIDYGPDLLKDMLEVLNLGSANGLTKLRNLHVSVCDDAIELVRQANEWSLHPALRSGLLTLIQSVLKSNHRAMLAAGRNPWPDSGMRDELRLVVARLAATSDRGQEIKAALMAGLDEDSARHLSNEAC